TVDRNGTNQSIIFKHRHPNGGSRAAKPCCRCIRVFGGVICKTDYLLCPHHPTYAANLSRHKWSARLLELGQFRGRTNPGGVEKSLAIEAVYLSEFGLANARGAGKYRMKNGF